MGSSDGGVFIGASLAVVGDKIFARGKEIAPTYWIENGTPVYLYDQQTGSLKFNRLIIPHEEGLAKMLESEEARSTGIVIKIPVRGSSPILLEGVKSVEYLTRHELDVAIQKDDPHYNPVV